MARITRKGAAVFVEHPKRQQRGWIAQPRHWHKAPLGRQKQTIGITAFKDKRAVIDIFAPNIKVHDGEGKSCSILPCFLRIAPRNPFSARLTIEIRGRNADRFDLRIIVEIAAHAASLARHF